MGRLHRDWKRIAVTMYRMHENKVIISGINGFVGRHLARELAKNNVEVFGIGHESEVSPEITDLVAGYYHQDLVEAWPDAPDVTGVVHLAGLAAVGPSFDEPQRYLNTNSVMVTNLCEYYLKQESNPRILIISSGAVYDPVQPQPINEGGKLGFTSPYAVSKVLNENQVAYYRGRGLDCVTARPFNHIGPGQMKGFILPDFYDRIDATTENTIKVGNIDTKRDYTDVRDIVRAYAAIILAKELGSSIYNVCSGKGLSGGEILEKLKYAMNRTDISFEIDKSLVRPSDVSEITGDSSRIRNELGWEPQINISQTIEDFVTSKRSSSS